MVTIITSSYGYNHYIIITNYMLHHHTLHHYATLVLTVDRHYEYANVL